MRTINKWEGQLIQKTFTLGSTNFDCWFIKIGNKFWFKVHDIAAFLGYQSPDDAVRRLVPSEARKSWEEFEPAMRQRVQIPPNWKPHIILISEGGLYKSR